MLQKISLWKTQKLRRSHRTANRLGSLVALLMVGLAILSPAHANVFDDVFGGDDAANFVEVVPAFPAAPKPEDLRQFFVSSATRFKFSIDLASLSIGTDKVIHYTLIAQSDQGAKNISFEGMRCDARTFKVYGYLAASGTFRASVDPVWQRIDEAEANRQRASLYKDYFCSNGRAASVADLVRSLKSNPYTQLGP
jgi:hypothetical protein